MSKEEIEYFKDEKVEKIVQVFLDSHSVLVQMMKYYSKPITFIPGGVKVRTQGGIKMTDDKMDITKAREIADTHNSSECDCIERICEDADCGVHDANVFIDGWESRHSEVDELKTCVAFFASVIQCGEPWTEQCKNQYKKVIGENR